MKIFHVPQGGLNTSGSLGGCCGPPSRFISYVAFQNVTSALSGGRRVLPLLFYTVSESLTNTSTALVTLPDQNVFGLHIVLKSGLRNLLMTSFAMMQLGPEAS